MKKVFYIGLVFLLGIQSCEKNEFKNKYEGYYDGVFYTTNKFNDTINMHDFAVKVDVVNHKKKLLQFTYISQFGTENSEITVFENGTFDEGYPLIARKQGFFSNDSLTYVSTTAGGNPLYYHFKGKKE